MDVRIVEFPATKVAAIEHHGSPGSEYDTARKLIAWRIENRLDPAHHATYGVHYTDPDTTPPELHRVDFCVAVNHDLAPNELGIVTKVIPGGRCAVARHLGSRRRNTTAIALCYDWLPGSGETTRDFPIFFQYVNVGPTIQESDMITDVYLPLR